MDQPTSLTSLMIVVTVAFLVPILLHHLKLRVIPVVVAEIVAGLVIGTSGFDIVTEDTWLKLLSLLGFIYLMFLSGVEIDFSLFRSKSTKRKDEPNPFAVSIIIFLIILLLAYSMALGLVELGFIEDPYLITLIIATISLGVVMPVLKERKLMDTKIGQTLLLITVISDFLTMILLAVYLSALSQDIVKMFLLFAFFLVVFIIYMFARRIPDNGLFALLGKGTVQLGTRAVFALILLFVVLSESFGVENILGAFLAGVIVSLLMPNKAFVHQLDTFGYGFLIPIFFVMVGVKLDIWQLFSDSKMLMLIPLLIFLIFLSKITPILLLRKWYPWPKVIGSGFLMSSTLSLAIAASTIALEIHIIDEQMHGALIMVAILTCLIFPVLFNKVFPKETEERTRVSIVGANHITLPVAQELVKSGYLVRIFTSHKLSDEQKEMNTAQSKIVPIEVSSLEPEILALHDVFETDIAVFGTTEDDANIKLARHAHSLGLERIIVRVEAPEKQEHSQMKGTAVFSTLFASNILLKALIEYPSAVQLITKNDDSIQEIRMGNPAFDQSALRRLPLLGNILILRIYRGDSFIIPHGNTSVQLDDLLLVSGEAEQIHVLKQRLES